MKKEIDEKEEMIYKEPSEEQLQKELEEIKMKRLMYQKEVAEEKLAYYQEEMARRRRKMRSFVKVALIVLVAGTSLFAFSMRSEATRMWWLERVEQIIGSESRPTINNDENRVISETEELEAAAELEEKINIPMPEMKYKPTGLIFDGHEYDELLGRGSLYYLYGEYVVTVQAHNADKDTSYGWHYEGELLSEEIIETDYALVKVQEIKSDGDNDSSAVAVWTYQNHQYRIAGKLPFEEIKKIIKNILF